MEVVDLATFARAWAVGRASFSWLLGAGSSAAAGVPTAGQIVDDLLLRLYASENSLVRDALAGTDQALRLQVRQQYDGRLGLPPYDSTEFYSAVFERVMPAAATRRVYLTSLMDGRRPSFGQRVLGTLIEAGHVDLVTTTNFDALIEQASAQAHGTREGNVRLLSVAGLDSADRAVAIASDRRWPLLVKLHGDYFEDSLKNLAGELRDQDERLRKVVADSSNHFGLVVVGYSGRDSSVMSMITEAGSAPRAWPHGVWWITRSPTELVPQVSEALEVLQSAGVSVRIVKAENFDETMGALADHTDLTPALRAHVTGLQSPSRVRLVALPSTDHSRGFPVLRMNALPILAQPPLALTARVDGGVTRESFETSLRSSAWRGCAVLADGQVLAFGEAGRLDFVLQSPGAATPVAFDVLSDGSSTHFIGLAAEALTRAIARRVGGRAQIRRARNRVILRPTDTPKTLGPLRDAYGTSLTGHLDPRLGKTLGGASRSYAEGIEVHVERRLDVTWLIFEPFTWTEPSAEMLQAPPGRRVLNQAGPWINERWAQRRRNDTWSRIIAAWADLISPDNPSTELHVLNGPNAEGPDVIGGTFTIGHTTAYSRAST